MAAYAPYILMAAGTAAKMVGDNNAEKERRFVLNQAFDKSARAQDKAAQQVLGEGNNFSGEKRAADMQTQEQSALAQALKDVGGGTPQEGAGAQIITGAGDAGQVSGDYLKAKADRAISEGDRLTAVARELSKVRAPGQLMNAEGLRRGDLTERLGSAAASNRAQVQAAGEQAQSIDTPWYGKLGQVASMIGSMWAMGKTGGAIGGQGASPYSLTGQGARLGEAPPRIRF